MARPSKFQPMDFEDEEHSRCDEPDEDYHTLPTTRPGKTLRMIDWIRGFKLGLFYFPIVAACAAIVAFFIATSPGHLDQDRAILAAFAVLCTGLFLGLLAIIVHFIGHVFNPTHDRLTYPTYMFRRSIPISEITDANCETLVGHNPIGEAIVHFFFQSASIGKSTSTSRRPRLPRVYIADVSGDFGVRQIRFGAKYKRNQFLRNLRVTAPHCRITRWN
jgi:hypothetical protein